MAGREVPSAGRILRKRTAGNGDWRRAHTVPLQLLRQDESGVVAVLLSAISGDISKKLNIPFLHVLTNVEELTAITFSDDGIPNLSLVDSFRGAAKPVIDTQDYIRNDIAVRVVFYNRGPRARCVWVSQVVDIRSVDGRRESTIPFVFFIWKDNLSGTDLFRHRNVSAESSLLCQDLIGESVALSPKR